MRKIICCLCALLLLADCGAWFAVSAAGASGEKDELVQAYIDEVVPEGAERIDSSFRTEYREINGGEYTRLDGKMEAEAYTYRLTADGETQYRTIVVLELLEKIRITENDVLELYMNDYLRNFSPEDGRLFTRSSPSEEWGNMREITPMPTGPVSVFGSEMQSGSKYTMVLLSFPSLGNPEPASASPEYEIHFRHETGIRINIPIWAAVLCMVLGLIVCGIVRQKRRRAQ